VVRHKLSQFLGNTRTETALARTIQRLQLTLVGICSRWMVRAGVRIEPFGTATYLNKGNDLAPIA